MQRAVAEALDTLDGAAGVVAEGEEGAQAMRAQHETAWSLVQRDAWLLLPEVAGRARAWMGDGQAPVRERGYRLAAVLRSLDLVDDLGRAQRSGEDEPDAAAALQKALTAYGMLGLDKTDR
jgi:hypothetical protein